jgi:hypothetical protein
MVYTKRLGISTLLGIVMGLLCWMGGAKAGVVFTGGMVAGTILNRAFIGFVIGISALAWQYLAHGAVIGVIGSLPMAAFSPNTKGFVMILVFGAIWGLLIELITTKVFKAPMGGPK